MVLLSTTIKLLPDFRHEILLLSRNKKEIKIYFTASSPPLGRPTPEIDPYERHAHNWREPKAKRLEKEKKNS
jgi:hypothetical protein